LMGTIGNGPGRTEDNIAGPVDYWVDEMIRFHRQYRVDTFNFWPAGADTVRQLELYATQVVPAVRRALATE
ncbi:MAG TPA: LLM class flavin-dependent oxidoreductase, partial [Anaerolineae bacterium]